MQIYCIETYLACITCLIKFLINWVFLNDAKTDFFNVFKTGHFNVARSEFLMPLLLLTNYCYSEK